MFLKLPLIFMTILNNHQNLNIIKYNEETFIGNNSIHFQSEFAMILRNDIFPF